MRRALAATVTADRAPATLRVCLWSGPRNVSTALMYSFAERADTVVVDEPLYGHYLRVSGANHPGRDEVIAAMNCDGDSVMDELQTRDLPPGKSVLFLKQMAHHIVSLDTSFMSQTANVLLVRDPKDMLPSLTVQIPDATLGDTGLETQWQLFERLQTEGDAPAIIDSRLLLLNPAEILEKLCRRLGIAFDPDMLSWSAGPREEDGIWAKHWYHAVHKSTGFQTYRPKPEFPSTLAPLLEECAPYYEKLYRHALR